MKKPKKDKSFVPVVMGKINSLLKNSRLEGNFTQGEASLVLGFTNPQYLSNIERELCSPSMETVIKLAKMYKIPPNKIVDVMMEDYSKAVKQRVKAG